MTSHYFVWPHITVCHVILSCDLSGRPAQSSLVNTHSLSLLRTQQTTNQNEHVHEHCLQEPPTVCPRFSWQVWLLWSRFVQFSSNSTSPAIHQQFLQRGLSLTLTRSACSALLQKESFTSMMVQRMNAFAADTVSRTFQQLLSNFSAIPLYSFVRPGWPGCSQGSSCGS